MMSAKPLLSICIPTYNRKNKLAQTLASLIPQCFLGEVEIIVSDNASDDGTTEYCMYQASTHSFFSYFRQERNVGFSDNLISVLSKANGKYLWMLGDDEVLHSEAVIRLLSAINTTDPSWLICNFVKIKSLNDDWPADSQISYDGGLHPLSLEEALEHVGIWASFMSVSVIRRDSFHEWLNCQTIASSDYIGFDIALFCGSKGKCFILSSPLLARINEPLEKHRFNNLSIYLFDFFDPIDSLVKRAVLSEKIRISLTHEMFLSMAGFLLISAKINGESLPKIGDCIHYHARVPMFWAIVFPLLILPSWLVRGGLGLLAWFLPKNSNSKLNRLMTSLGVSNKG